MLKILIFWLFLVYCSTPNTSIFFTAHICQDHEWISLLQYPLMSIFIFLRTQQSLLTNNNFNANDSSVAFPFTTITQT